MKKLTTACLGVVAAVSLVSTLSACSDDGEPSADTNSKAIFDMSTPTPTPAPIDVESVRDSVRTSGSNLVVNAGWFDCMQETPTTCTGEAPVAPKDNDALDDVYDDYSATCQERISRSKFRLDMAERVRPWIVDDEADQVVAAIDGQTRTATATIKQTDGSSVVLHFELKSPYGIQPACNSDGTFAIERR
ncbi:hypothetical protein [Prescottella equi]